MARQVEYVCNTCGFEHTSLDQIFWIGEDRKITVAPLLMSTSDESYSAPVKGFFAKYYCYECNKFVNKFIIYKKSEMDDGEIIRLIEGYDDSSKIIQFDDEFQKCLECGKELPSKANYLFALDEDDEFRIIKDSEFLPDGNYKFAGEFYGYVCASCKKQINKFVITQNDGELTDSEMKKIIKEHTRVLTIFIRRDINICPDCGEEVYYLDENSTCPKCRRDQLAVSNVMMVD